MKNLLNRVAISIFTRYTKTKGYSFKQVETLQEHADANNIFNEEGYVLPANYQKEMEVYKKDAIKFIAYHNNVPVGTVGLANPKVVNRPFALHGIDEAGAHFEIQSLVVKKDFRDGSQLVLLGLFKEMYIYSLRNQVNSWISFGMRQLYLTLRRYNKNINLIDIDDSNNKFPLTLFLYENKIFDTCFTMDIKDFAPSSILKKFIKKRFRKIEILKKSFWQEQFAQVQALIPGM